ncbi:MAG: sialate O-acetylesterase, partial [Verrucomicrobiota bacterium]
MVNSLRFCLAVICLSATALPAAVHLPEVFGDNMVLQSGQPVRVCGQADPGEIAVTVQFKSQVRQAIPDAEGNWEITFDALSPSADPADMTISGYQTSLVLHNILVGEVWFCGGQSNMESLMSSMTKEEIGRQAYELELQIADTNHIRLFRVNHSLVAGQPISDGWSTCTSNALSAFSAVGYYFGKQMHAELDVPVGLIESAYAGSLIEPWIPLEAGTNMGIFDDTYTVESSGLGTFYPSRIEPLTGFTIRGALWWQGESNVTTYNDSLRYVDKMRALITGWRNAWRNYEMRFYFVQLPPYCYSSRTTDPVRHTSENLPEFWEAQTLCLAIPNTGMTVMYDLVSNVYDMHPVNRWDVGKRLGNIALVKDFGRTSLICSGPTFRSMAVSGTNAVLFFDNIGSGLTSRDTNQLTYFEMAGLDGVFHQAFAVIEGGTVKLSSPSTQQPRQVRFGWNETARPNLCNIEGLPARPFRTTHLSVGLVSYWPFDTTNVNGTTPDLTSEGAAVSRTYTTQADGVWYFHVRTID